MIFENSINSRVQNKPSTIRRQKRIEDFKRFWTKNHNCHQSLSGWWRHHHVIIFSMSQIEAIQATATDALSCKIYAIKRGYYRDDPMTTLITAEPERKSPEIARGTWARVMGTRTRLEGFLQATDGRKNIINCGCGFDTSFW